MIKNDYFIGTSGWHYHGWIGNLYPESMQNENMLEFYMHKFNSVELNTSFYGLPSEKSIMKWRELTPTDFIFSCKASRYLTHIKRLTDYQEGLKRLMDRLEMLGEKLGPILFQLPPKFALNFERLEQFIGHLPSEFLYTFEFRDTSWLCQKVYDLLQKHKIALCFYDFKGVKPPEIVLTNFVYLRMHGPNLEPYVGHYDQETLKSLAKKFIDWKNKGYKIFCYFDNDQKSCAPADAASIQHLLIKWDK